MKSEGVISSPSSPPSPLTSQWQYLYSHTATANLPALDPSYIGGGAADVEPYSVFTPNSVNIYLASPYNPLYGLVRVAIKVSSGTCYCVCVVLCCVVSCSVVLCYICVAQKTRDVAHFVLSTCSVLSWVVGLRNCWGGQNGMAANTL